MTGGGSEVDGPATGPGALFLSAPNPVWAGGAPTVPASWVAVPGAAAAPAATVTGGMACEPVAPAAGGGAVTPMSTASA